MTSRIPHVRPCWRPIYLFFIVILGFWPVLAATGPVSPASGPFLWRVEGAQPSWLFGTIHSSDPRIATLTPSTWKALDSSRSFHPEIELSADVAAVVAQKLFLSEAPDLATRLPSPLWARVVKASSDLGLPEPILHRLTPGMAALLFSSPIEFDPDATVDGQLYQRAKSRSLKISALETIDEQMGVFEHLPEPHAIAALKDALDESDSGRPSQGKLLAAYASGNEQAVLAVVQEGFAKSAPMRALADPLLYRRNRLMADRLVPYLRAGGAFTAIGVAHLIGPKSVIELLRTRGYKVTRAR